MGETIIRIASFNIKDFSNNSVTHNENKDSKKNLATIAKIINDNHIDIIAIQEMTGKNVLRELLSAIAFHYVKDKTADDYEEANELISNYTGDDYLSCEAGNWEGRWTHPNSKWGTAIVEEGYAFIWNKNTIRLPYKDGNQKKGEVWPVIKHKKEAYFVRPPFYGRFVPKNAPGEMEIRLLNIHVLYTKNMQLKKLKDSGIDMSTLSSLSREDYEDTYKRLRYEFNLTPMEIKACKEFLNQNDVERRKGEVKNIVTEIMAREEDIKPYGAYTFLVGDYNLNIKDENGTYKNKRASIDSEIIFAERKPDEKKYCIVQDKLTTLTTPPKEEKDPDDLYGKREGEERFANSYDHITYNENMPLKDGRQISISDPIRINVIDEYGMTTRKYFESISDHLPIMFEVKL